MNFSKNLFYTHKKYHIFYLTYVEGQSVEVFVTKLYKLVKINDKGKYIFDAEDFISLLVSSICKTNICRKLGLKRNFNFTYKRANFSYTKALDMLKALKLFIL